MSLATPTPPPIVVTRRIEIAPKTIFLVLGAIAGVWLLGQVTTVLTVVIVALIMVGTFDPLVGWLEHRGFRRGRALVLVFVVAALLFTAVVLLMVPPLLSQLLDLIERLPKERQQIVRSLEGEAWAKPLLKAIKDLPLDNVGANAGRAMLGYSTKLLEVMTYGISTMFLAIYLLADPAGSKGLLYIIVPRHHHLKLAKILLELKTIVGGYMRGQLITSLSIAVFVFILLTVLGAENALAIALFAGLTDIIPFVGGYIASTPVVVAVTPLGGTVVIIVVVIMVIYQEFESRLLVPRVYGRVLRLPPAVVLVALLLGGTLAGILGALLALPIAAGLQMLIRELHVDLPGQTSPHVEAKELDERATEVYEQLTEGASAADAGVIADDLASFAMEQEAKSTAAEPQRGDVQPGGAHTSHSVE
ncbi:MAG: AI-2E family transporter [Deltaproteobacteria bacterium]|nr:AI-2E family transporter [Deltaproteobacteria bacterium]